jgi:hypothetical protein
VTVCLSPEDSLPALVWWSLLVVSGRLLRALRDIRFFSKGNSIRFISAVLCAFH